MSKNRRTIPLLAIGMVAGLVITVIGATEFGIDISASFQTFNILSVDTDPVSGEITGNVILGKPTISGMTWTGAPTTEGFSKGSTCPLRTSTFSPLTKGYPASFGTGSFSGGCSAGFAEWDLSDLPDTLQITSMVFKIKDQRWFPFLTEPSSRNCKIGILEQPIDTIAKSSLFQKMNAPDFILQDGDWCSTSGEKSFIVNQVTIDAFERALKGDDKITLSFAMSTLAKGTGCCWESDATFWGTQGSWIINGFADPISCPVGEQVVGFKCEPLQCDTGFEVNGNICSQITCNVGEELVGSICKPVICEVGDRLVGSTCEQIICSSGTLLVGNECQQIICDTGLTLSGNDCIAIVCPSGNELTGSQCQSIICPTGTFLQGNDCNAISCPIGNFLEGNNCIAITCEAGENLIGNICKPIQCELGETLVGNFCETITCESGNELVGNECLPIVCLATEQLEGNNCNPIPLNCPNGTVEQNNTCVQVIPQLQAGFDLGSNALTIAGLMTFAIFATGFVIQRVRRTS